MAAFSKQEGDQRNKKILVAVAVMLIIRRRRAIRKARVAGRTCGTKNWIAERDQKEEFNSLLCQLKLEDPGAFTNYHRFNINYMIGIVFCHDYLIPRTTTQQTQD